MFELLQQLGFSSRWRDWIAMLLRSSSSAFLLNGDPGIPLIHRRGLRQGDSLSPLLFILAIDILHRLITKAADDGILAPLPGRELKLRTSMYADDVVIFANPVRKSLTNCFRSSPALGKSQACTSTSASAPSHPFAVITLTFRKFCMRLADRLLPSQYATWDYQ